MPTGAEARLAARTCPVCGGASVVVARLPAEETRARLGEVFDCPPPASVAIADYELVRCQACALEFGDPMTPGDGAFYDWVTGFARYRAAARWEWRALKALLRAEHRPLSLLEVGCGSGLLLAYLSDVPGLNACGVDRSEASVAEARRNGLNAQVADFATLDRAVAPGARFDAIVLSHVLEHISDPLACLRALVPYLAAGGRIYVCLPYSPMSRELIDRDVMNLPPHHLTRWNQRALAALAAAASMRVALHPSRAKSALKRALHFTWVKRVGTEKNVPVWRRVSAVLANLHVFRALLRIALGRERIAGRRAGDNVLAVFTPAHGGR